MEEFFAKLIEYLPSITSIAACFTAVITCIKTVGAKTKDSLKRMSDIKNEVINQNKITDEVLHETKETKEEVKEMVDKCQLQINETSDALKKMADLNVILKKLSEDVNVLKKRYQNKGKE